MNCLDKFNRKMSLSGGSMRNERIRNSRELLNETFADDASFTHGVYMWEHGLDDYSVKEPLKIRFYNRRYSAANGVVVKFQTLIDNPIQVGDIVYSSLSDEYLICTESFNIDNIHWQGKVTLCNWILKWQNNKGDILEYPCFDINATQYNSGEMSNKWFTVGSSQHLLMLPYDENTIVLKSPQRFFLDRDMTNPTSFVVTQNDNTSMHYGKKGIVRLTVFECATNNDTDRFDLGICDYIDKDDLKNDNGNDNDKRDIRSIISYDTTVVKSGGDYQSFIGRFFDDRDIELTDVVSKWEIVCDFKDVLDTNVDGNKITIGIDNDAYIDEEFKLILTDEHGNHPSSILVRVESLL